MAYCFPFPPPFSLGSFSGNRFLALALLKGGNKQVLIKFIVLVVESLFGFVFIIKSSPNFTLGGTNLNCNLYFCYKLFIVILMLRFDPV